MDTPPSPGINPLFAPRFGPLVLDEIPLLKFEAGAFAATLDLDLGALNAVPAVAHTKLPASRACAFMFT